VYALWKRKFPILKALRGHLDHCQDIVLATAILHNMALMWKEDNSEDEGDEEEPQAGDDFEIEDGEDNAAARARRGRHLRDELRRRMPD
jgi:hypothetical protein